MFENSSNFLVVMVMLLVIVFLIFVMKYGAQIFRAKADAACAAGTELRIRTLTEKSHELEQRIGHLEALLREVE